MIKDLTIAALYTLSETIAADLFDGKTYPWEVLPEIKDFILKLGNTLSTDLYEKKGENIWIAKSAKVAPTACINGPCIICGSKTLCFYPWQCHRGERCCGGQFHRVKECGSV